jgi:hypothetical protein
MLRTVIKKKFLCFFDISIVEKTKKKFFFADFGWHFFFSFCENQQKIGSYAKTSCPSKKQLFHSKLFLWLKDSVWLAGWLGGSLLRLRNWEELETSTTKILDPAHLWVPEL